jgi:hypothetical protein
MGIKVSQMKYGLCYGMLNDLQQEKKKGKKYPRSAEY